MELLCQLFLGVSSETLGAYAHLLMQTFIYPFPELKALHLETDLTM